MPVVAMGVIVRGTRVPPLIAAQANNGNNDFGVSSFRSVFPLVTRHRGEQLHFLVKKMAKILLRHMRKNQAGVISQVKVGGELGQRVREMGLVPGTEIVVQGRAPLFDPVALRIMGGTLTLRNNEADHIVVEVDGS